MISARWPTAAALAFCAVAPSALAQPSIAEITAPLSAPRDPAAYLSDRRAAEAAMEANDFAAAEPILARLTQAYAEDADTWAALGLARRQLGQRAEAIEAYRRVIALAGPEYSRARLRIATLQAQSGDLDAALGTLESVVFADGYLQRPALMRNDAFAALHANDGFHSIAGAIDVDGLSREQGWRLDLDFLMAEIRRLTPRYRNGGALPEEALAIERELRGQLGALSDAQIYAGMARLVGALNQNHTMMWGVAPDGPPPERPALRYLPLQFYFFPEGLYIVGAGDGLGDLEGARVISIEGRPALEAFARVREAMSVGAPAEALLWGPLRIMDATLLQGLGLSDDNAEVTLRLRLRNGRTVTRTIATATTPIIGKLPPPVGAAAPRFLQRVDESHWFEPLDAATLYAQVNQIAPDEDETLPAFGLRLRAALVESGARNLILDLRHNNGGDTFTYTELLRTLIGFTAQPDRRLYVLIGRNTYSAAANLAADLERLADPIFVGEPTGGAGNQDGDEGAVRLPYSGLSATIAGVWWQLSHPWDGRRSIAPDAPVQLTAADYFAGRDPALDFVQSDIARR